MIQLQDLATEKAKTVGHTAFRFCPVAKTTVRDATFVDATFVCSNVPIEETKSRRFTIII
jgi:hypothetical protein